MDTHDHQMPSTLAAGGSAPNASDLMAKVASGDAGAFAQLYDQLAAPVYGLSLRILRDPHDAEDATLATLMQIWRSAPRYDPARACPLTWAMTIAYRRALDQVHTTLADHDETPTRRRGTPNKSTTST